MIQGHVNSRHEATVILPIRYGNGHIRDVEVVIDTGFSGALALPRLIVSDCHLTWQGREQATLADGGLT